MSRGCEKCVPMTDVLKETLHPNVLNCCMICARQAAATGYITSESIPLLALTNESFIVVNFTGRSGFLCRHQTHPLLADSLPLLLSDKVPIVPRHLESALRLAAPFSYSNDATHLLFNSPFLRLPDLSVLQPPSL